MPTYDLMCERCGIAFEVFRQRLLRDEDRGCPSCGGRGATRWTSAYVSRSVTRSSPPQVTGFARHTCCGGACRH